MKNKIIKIYLLALLMLPLIAASCEEPISVSQPEPPVSTGMLIINSVPPGAKIFLNDKNTGRLTPDSVRWLDENVYKVTLKLYLHKDTVFYAKAEENKINQVSVDYYANPAMFGSLLCNSEPQRASITINGKKTNQFTPYTFRNLKPGGYMVHYQYYGCRDDSEYVVVKSSETGLSSVALQDTSVWLDFNMQNSPMPSNKLTVIAVDQRDVKWIGTEGKGLISYDNNEWKTYTTENSLLPGNYINCLKTESVVNGSKLWVGTNNGLAVIGPNGTSVYNTANSKLPDNEILSVNIDLNGNKYIGTYKGLAVLSSNNLWTVYSISSVTKIGFQYSKVWIGTGLGFVMSLAGTTLTNEKTVGLEIKSLSAGSTSGGVWVGYYEKDRFSEKGGVLMYDNGIWKDLQGLPGLIPECIVMNEGERWIGTNN
ncbi:MAG: PEGA domain-containing protein, partial [Syntrophothermus sp.]